MNNTEYLSTLVSRLRYAPQTLQEAKLLKAHLLAEFIEQDVALNDLISKMNADEIEAQINEQRERELNRFFRTEQE